MLKYKSTKSWMVKSFEFVWFHYAVMLDYCTLFRINEYTISAPFKLSSLRFPSETHILIEDMVVLFTGLKVTLFVVLV